MLVKNKLSYSVVVIPVPVSALQLSSQEHSLRTDPALSLLPAQVQVFPSFSNNALGIILGLFQFSPFEASLPNV